MHLINTSATYLKEFTSRKTPAYAILSHRWAPHDVSFAQLQRGLPKNFARPLKFHGFLQQAEKDGLKYGWIDTCCINKDSSAELSEAINSMYRWYKNARVCYVYMADVDREDWQKTFARSQWFKRGWTLQELLAPSNVKFYDRCWNLLGSKEELAGQISRITGIPPLVLKNESLQQFSIAERMSWAADRVTTRVEDIAYCLMGLFDVNMPLLYGEGEKAFLRLQEEIIKASDDHSIFAWSMTSTTPSGLLAPSPSNFRGCKDMVSERSNTTRKPFSMTNRGLHINLRITPWSADTYLAYLDCVRGPATENRRGLGIFLRRLSEPDQYARIKCSGKGVFDLGDSKYYACNRPTEARAMFVRQNSDTNSEIHCLADCWYGFKLSDSLLRSTALQESHHANDGYVAILSQGACGFVAMVDVSPTGDGLRKIALGFDFSFNPVCLVQDETVNGQPKVEFAKTFDWALTTIDGVQWYRTIDELSLEPQSCNGLKFLKGHRIRGLDFLYHGGRYDGCLFTLERKEHRSRFVWELNIGSLIGPSRGHDPAVLRSSFGDRRGFQRSHGLSMSEEDLVEGDNILTALYDSKDFYD